MKWRASLFAAVVTTLCHATPCDEVLNRMYFDKWTTFQLSTHAAMDPLTFFSYGPLENITPIKDWLDLIGVKTAQLEVVPSPSEQTKYPALQILPDATGPLANQFAALFKEGFPGDATAGNIYYIPRYWSECQGNSVGGAFHPGTANIFLSGNLPRAEVVGRSGLTSILSHELWHAWLDQMEQKLASRPSLLEGAFSDDRMGEYVGHYNLQELLTHTSDAVLILFRLRRAGRDLEKLAQAPSIGPEPVNRVKADIDFYTRLLKDKLDLLVNHKTTLTQGIGDIRAEANGKTIPERISNGTLKIRRHQGADIAGERIYVSLRARSWMIGNEPFYKTNIRLGLGDFATPLTDPEIEALARTRLAQFETNVLVPLETEVNQIRLQMEVFGDTPEKVEAIELHNRARALLKSIRDLASRSAPPPTP